MSEFIHLFGVCSHRTFCFYGFSNFSSSASLLFQICLQLLWVIHPSLGRLSVAVAGLGLLCLYQRNYLVTTNHPLRYHASERMNPFHL